MKARALTYTLALAGLASLAASPALAQCFSATQIPAGMNFFEVEGPITSYDVTNYTMSTMGTTIRLPGPDFEFDVGGGEFRTFAEITNSTLEGERPIKGDKAQGREPAIIIALGTLVDNVHGCAEFHANEAEFVWAEHVTVGPLMGVTVTATDTTFLVNGITVKMTDDPRAPRQLLDASGNTGEVTIPMLANWIGTIIGGDGYMERDTLRAFIFESSAYRPREDGRENVIIEVGRYGADDGEVRAVGFVANTGPGAPVATHVEIYTGVEDLGVETNPTADPRDGTSCNGTLRGRAALFGDPLNPSVKEYTFRARVPDGTPDQENICVVTGTLSGTTFVAHGASGSNSRALDQR